MRKISLLLMVILVGALVGCDEQFTDVSKDAKFRQLVGARYEVVGALDAYGIRQHSKAKVEYTTLIPPPGIAGSEVGFRITIEPGSTITVLKVLKTNRWPDPDLTLEIQLTGTRMPVETIIKIDLFRGNEGQGIAQLNPRIYRRIASQTQDSLGFRNKRADQVASCSSVLVAVQGEQAAATMDYRQMRRVSHRASRDLACAA